jgi:hypothetical protein
MPHRHQQFYFSASNDDDELNLIVVQVDDRLFRVHRSKLASASAIFDDLFSLPQDPSNIEGRSDDHPIQLAHSPLAEFEQLLCAIYTPEAEVTMQVLFTRMDAASRWDAPAMRTKTVEQLAAADDPVAQLAAARRYDLDTWPWPALFAICARQVGLTAEERNMLDPPDLLLIDPIREQLHPTVKLDFFKLVPSILKVLTKAGHGSYRNDARIRQLLAESKVEEPLVSDLRPPLSGFRMRLRSGAPFPYDRAGEPPFRDLDGAPVYLGSAVLQPQAVVTMLTPNKRDTAPIVVPCKVTPRIRPDHHVGWQGRETCTHEYEILPFNPARMEWVQTSEGHIPDGRTPVEGGYDADHSPFFHAYGSVVWGNRTIDCPGKTSVALGCARLPFGGQDRTVKNEYHILVWK